MKITQEIRAKIAAEVQGSGMGSIELRELGISLGFPDWHNLDLDIAVIAEEEGVRNCDTCNWWCEEAEMHNDICSDCYQKDDDV